MFCLKALLRVAQVFQPVRQVLFATQVGKPVLPTSPEFQPPTDFPVTIDMGYAFGDACVKIDGYPLKLFPPSGIMQVIAYESINVEVLSRLVATAKTKETPPNARKR